MEHIEEKAKSFHPFLKISSQLLRMITFSPDTLQGIPLWLLLNYATQIANRSHPSPSFCQIHWLLFHPHLPDSRQFDTVHTCLLWKWSYFGLRVTFFLIFLQLLGPFLLNLQIGTHRAQSSPLLTLFHQPQGSFLHANFGLSLPCLWLPSAHSKS